MPRGAKRFRGNEFVKEASGSSAILGFFSDPGDPPDRRRYLLVVNRSPNRASKTRLTIPSAVRRVEKFDTETGTFGPATLTGAPPRFFTASLKAGRAILYRLSKT